VAENVPLGGGVVGGGVPGGGAMGISVFKHPVVTKRNVAARKGKILMVRWWLDMAKVCRGIWID
jgi:hypothetical protein